MNERIQELAGQMGFHPDLFEMCRPGMEKLAELIVRECADVLVTEMNRLDELNRVVAAQTLDTAQVLIKQHFGVK